jgi:hypothetical protein
MAKHVITVCLVALLLPVLCSPVLAHTAAQMGLPPDQYDLGIPVYWPYHAFLMTAGFALFLGGFVVMRAHKTSNWYKSHMALQTAGGIAVISGISISTFMVALSGAPHLRYSHDMLGAGTILLIVCTLMLGYIVYKKNPDRESRLRTTHRWSGYTSIALVAVNIALGISMMTMVLAQ